MIFFFSLVWRNKVKYIICSSLHLKGSRGNSAVITINMRLGWLLILTLDGLFYTTCCIFNRWHFSTLSNTHLVIQQRLRWFSCSSDRSEIMLISLISVFRIVVFSGGVFVFLLFLLFLVLSVCLSKIMKRFDWNLIKFSGYLGWRNRLLHFGDVLDSR